MILLDQAGAGAGGARFFAPSAAHRPFVEHFWTQQLDSSPSGRTWRVIPDLNPYLIFVILRDGSRLDARCTLVGPRSRFADVAMADRLLTCGVRFRPGALSHLTRLPTADFTDQSVPIEAALGAPGARLMEQLRESSSVRGAFQSIAVFLRGAWTGQSGAASVALEECSRVAELAARAGLSARKLHSRLTEEIGLAPKRILRIQRLHRTLLCCQDPSLTWAQVAASSGFADQAHMIREFVDLLGESPTAWWQRNRAPISSIRRTAPHRMLSRD